MKRLHSVERRAHRQAEATLWQTHKMFWTDLRYEPELRNMLISQEISELGYPVTWVYVGNQLQPQVFQ